ncbi:unnamed protein product, partial [Mesorhabditis spiculigera]
MAGVKKSKATRSRPTKKPLPDHVETAVATVEPEAVVEILEEDLEPENGQAGREAPIDVHELHRRMHEAHHLRALASTGSPGSRGRTEKVVKSKRRSKNGHNQGRGLDEFEFTRTVVGTSKSSKTEQRTIDWCDGNSRISLEEAPTVHSSNFDYTLSEDADVIHLERSFQESTQELEFETDRDDFVPGAPPYSAIVSRMLENSQVQMMLLAIVAAFLLPLICAQNLQIQACCGVPNLCQNFSRAEDLFGVACCGNQPYNAFTRICCSGAVRDRKTADGRYAELCCGTETLAYDQTCCAGVVHNVAGGDCCGSAVYSKSDPSLKCCNETLVRATSGTDICCGATTFDGGRTQMCCGQQVFQLSDFDSCCESPGGTFQQFNSATQFCCGVPQQKNGNMACCYLRQSGSLIETAYDKTRQCCKYPFDIIQPMTNGSCDSWFSWQLGGRTDPDGKTAPTKAVAWAKYKDGLPAPYSTIPCLDATRVHVKEANNPDGFYHANWIRPPNSDQQYILAQSPNQTNSEDFWAMVFQEKVSCIVLIRGRLENEAAWKPYYPQVEGEMMFFGRYTVSNAATGEFEFENPTELLAVVARHLLVLRDGVDTPLEITHIHINSTSNYRPNFDMGLCELLVYLREVKNVETILLHDEPYSGRADTLVLLAMFMDEIETCPKTIGDRGAREATFRRLRRCRAEAVRSHGQYLFALGMLEIYHSNRYGMRMHSDWLKQYVRLMHDRVGPGAMVMLVAPCKEKETMLLHDEPYIGRSDTVALLAMMMDWMKTNDTHHLQAMKSETLEQLRSCRAGAVRFFDQFIFCCGVMQLYYWERYGQVPHDDSGFLHT